MTDWKEEEIEKQWGFVRAQRIYWLGHAMRMRGTRTRMRMSKKVLDAEYLGTRRKDWSRKWWMEDVRKVRASLLDMRWWEEITHVWPALNGLYIVSSNIFLYLLEILIRLNKPSICVFLPFGNSHPFSIVLLIFLVIFMGYIPHLP